MTKSTPLKPVPLSLNAVTPDVIAFVPKSLSAPKQAPQVLPQVTDPVTNALERAYQLPAFRPAPINLPVRSPSWLYGLGTGGLIVVSLLFLKSDADLNVAKLSGQIPWNVSFRDMQMSSPALERMGWNMATLKSSLNKDQKGTLIIGSAFLENSFRRNELTLPQFKTAMNEWLNFAKTGKRPAPTVPAFKPPKPAVKEHDRHVPQPKLKTVPAVPTIPVVNSYKPVPKVVKLPKTKSIKASQPFITSQEIDKEFQRLCASTRAIQMTSGIDNITGAAKKYGVSENDIRALMASRPGMSAEHAAQILSSRAKFGNYAGSHNGIQSQTPHSLNSELESVIQNIKNAPPQLVRNWVASLSPNERNALPARIKQAVSEKLNHLELLNNLKITVSPDVIEENPGDIEKAKALLKKHLGVILNQNDLEIRKSIEVLLTKNIAIKIVNSGTASQNLYTKDIRTRAITNHRLAMGYETISDAFKSPEKLLFQLGIVAHEAAHAEYAYTEEYYVNIFDYPPGSDKTRQSQKELYVKDRTDKLMEEEAAAHYRQFQVVAAHLKASALPNHPFYVAGEGKLTGKLSPSGVKKVIELIKSDLYPGKSPEKFAKLYDREFPP